MSDVIIVALIGLIPSLLTLVVTSITNSKVKKQSKLKEEMQKGFEKLNYKIDNNRMKTLKNILVNNYTEMINGASKSKEQLQDIAEMFTEYKLLGGDSYIDDLHDIWKAKEIKK